MRMPRSCPRRSRRLMASFLARRTMFSIMAPEEKSLKYMTSLSPFWYVTSRKRLASSVRYIVSTVRSIITRTAFSGSPPPSDVDLVRRERQVGLQVAAEDLRGGVLVRPLDLDLHVEPTGTEDGGVDQVLAVRRADHDDVLQRLDAVDLGEQLRHDRRLHVGADAGATGAEQRVHLVEEDDDGHALLALLPRPLEHEADLTLGLADVLVEQLRALDVEEVDCAPPACPVTSLTFLLSELATALAMSVLPQPGGPYSRMPFGAGSLYSTNSSRCRNGSSTASVIASIWLSRPPTSS